MRHLPFFQITSAPSFERYGTAHMCTLFLVTIAAISIVAFKNRITHKADRTIRIVATALALACEISYHAWAYVNELDFIASMLSLDLCHITTILALFLNLSNLLRKKTHEKIFPLLYFWSEGAVAALLFPTIKFGPGTFRFHHFFYSHAYIVLTALYCLFIDKYKINSKSYVRAFGTLTGFAPFVWAIDVASGQNYMFLAGPDDTETPLDAIGEGPTYYLNFFLLTAFCMFLLVLPHEFKNIKNKRKLAKAIAIAEEDGN